MEKRFEIASFDIDEPSVLIDNDTYQVILTLRDYCYDEINFLEDLLNEQNEKIKELENLVIKDKDKIYRKNDQIKELQNELNFKNNIILDENDRAILRGDCYCLNNDVRRLVEENQQLKQQLAKKEEVIKMLKDIKRYDVGELLTENIKLKQTQNSKAIEVLEKIKKYFCEEEVDGDDIKTGDWIYMKDIVEVAEYIDNQITELRGGGNV